MIGTSVGSYLVTQKIATGGMGTVYKAEHQLIGKLAAVKVLHAELCNNREVVNRFFNEAKATTQIKHAGIVEIFDFGYLPSGDAYIVMEFLEGMSLARRLTTRGKMEEGEAAMLLRAVCSALGAAHGKKIVHRDLKPDNIFLVPDPESATGERPKLLDFGIAKLTDTIGAATTATKTGSVMGTPTYMSPEQCRGTGDIDHRSDLYSIGCIFYELVTGRAPFEAEGAGELIGAHLFVQPESPRVHNPAISKEAETLILALLAKKPENRPQTAKELGQRLSQLATYQGWITATTPSGVTTESLRALVPERPVTGPVATDQTLASGEHLVPTPSGVNTPVPAPISARAASQPVAAGKDDEAPLRTMSPTTLSGAASSIIDVPKRRGKWVALAGAVVVVGGLSFGVARLLGGKSSDKTPAAATQPVESPVAQPAVTPPAATTTQPAATQPAVAEPKAADMPKPTDTPKVTEPAVTDTPKVADTPKDAETPKKTEAPRTVKAVKTTKPGTSKTTKTTTRTTKPTGKTPKPLIETDL